MKVPWLFLVLVLNLVLFSCAQSDKNGNESQYVPHAGFYYLGGDAKNPISYGVEIEPDFVNHPKMANYYRPQTYSLEEWKELSLEERASIADQLCRRGSELVNYYVKNEIVLGDSSDFPELPQKMDCDYPGATEINGLVFEKISDLRNFIEKFTTEVGPAGSQTHVVFDRPKELPGAVGYALYEADRAMLKRTAYEHRKYEKIVKENIIAKEKRPLPGTNLVSTALFPISHWKWARIKKFFRDFKQGKLGDDDLVGKYLGLNFRTRSYPVGKMGFEIRSYDNTAEAGMNNFLYEDGPKELIIATDRSSHLLEKYSGFPQFKIFEDLALLRFHDAENFREGLVSLAKLYQRILLKTYSDQLIENDDFNLEETINQIEQIKEIPQKKYENLGRLANDRGRPNTGKGRPYYFFYPYRNWASYAEKFDVLNDEELLDFNFNLLRSSINLIAKTLDILKKKGDSDDESVLEKFYRDATVDLRKAIGKWANESGLENLFEKFERKNKLPPFKDTIQ